MDSRRGEIWLVRLDPTLGAEIRKTRPVVVVNSDAIGVLPIRLVAPLTEWKDYFAHISFFPGLMIVITVLAFNFLGDGLRDALDPRERD